MRPLTVLYKIAYGRLMFAEEGKYRGICHIIMSLESDGLITIEEGIALYRNLYKNKPSEWKHLEFFSEEQWMGSDDGPFWWKSGDMEPRKRFLRKMINYSKPWYVKLYLLWKGELIEKTSQDT